MGTTERKRVTRVERRCGIGGRAGERSAGSYWRPLLSILFLSLALNSIGRADLLVASFNTGQVLRFDDATGDFTSVFATCLPGDHPIGMTLGPDGNLYVAVGTFGGSYPSFVRRFNGETGAFIDTFVSGGGLTAVQDLQFGPDGNLYVSSLAGTSPGSRVTRYDGITGAFIDVFVPPGSGGLTGAEGIAFGPDGNLYVTSLNTSQILRYDGSTGAFLGVFSTTEPEPNDLEFGLDGNLYVLDHPGGASYELEVRRFNGHTGDLIDVFVSRFAGGSQGFMTFGPDRNIYVSTGEIDSVKVFNGLTGKGDTFVGEGSGGLSQGAGIVFARTLCDQFSSYGPCDDGAAMRCRADGLLEAGRNLLSVTQIDVLSCGAADGADGFHITSDCPGSYTYCVESHDDGAGNRVKLGVVERAAPGVVVVNDASDALHDAGCATSGTGDCTLRDAMTFANADAGANEIRFAIPGGGAHTITLASDLPAIFGALTIDGYTQPGSSPNTSGAWLGDNAVLTIEINGNGKACFTLNRDANIIRGLVINRCAGAAITAEQQSSENPVPSIVVGNFIGVDPSGSTALPNNRGIFLGQGDEEPGLLIGDGTPGGRNVISGNDGSGILCDTFGGRGCALIQGNFIGTDATGTIGIPNGASGIENGFFQTRMTILDNLISGNAGRGISLNEAFADIEGNRIGTDVSGTLPVGNLSTGIWSIVSGSFFSSSGLIQGNTIAFNGAGDPRGGGIVALSSSHHQGITDPTIVSNSIFDNTSDGSLPGGGLGISLGGGNLACESPGEGQPPQNFPVLTSAVSDGVSVVRIRGTLERTTTFRLEFFTNPACDPSGFGEGKTSLGFADVTANDINDCPTPIDVLLPVAVPAGQVLTATATDQSTSQFSNCVVVQAAPSPQVVNDLVQQTSITQQSSRTPVPGGPKGTMTVRATFKNTSTTPIAVPYFVVTTLSEGNLLLNADGAPGGVGAKLTGDVGADNVLSPGESFKTEFVVGLHNRRRFRFFVDVWGVLVP